MIKNVRRALEESVIALNEKRAADAVKVLEKALKKFGANMPLLNNYAAALMALERWQEAAVHFKRALMIEPTSGLHRNLAVTLRMLRQHDEAMNNAKIALHMDRASAPAWEIYGVLLQELNLIDDAIKAFENAIFYNSGAVESGLNRGYCHLLKQDYAQGWRDWHARWFTPAYAKFHTAMNAQGRWYGEPLAGKTIFVWHEQGLGDTIMFARYLPLLVAQGAKVLFKCQPEAQLLFAGLAGVTLVDDLVGEVRADYHAPLGDLPRWLGTTDEASIPPPVTISVDMFLKEKWSHRMNAKGVGVAWSGNPNHANDHNRSIPLAQFWSALASLEEAHDFVALQRDCNASDRDALWDSGILEFGPQYIKSLADSAAMLANLQTVVTVDTAFAHLAGSMGKRTLLLVPFHPDWRWGMDSETTAWYPSVTLLRQDARGDWTAPLARVAKILTGAHT